MRTMYHCTLVIILVLCTVAHAAKPGDLYTALNTSDYIWLKRRSYNLTGHTCVLASRISLNKTDYKFHQNYTVGTEKKSLILYGKLNDTVENPYMIVSNVSGQGGRMYTLKYWNDTETCGILTLNLRMSGQQQCEMHVWETNINKTVTECDKEYKKLCENRTYDVYLKTCERNAAQRN
uniref:Putative group i salivary lipocalin n=1 Tax=Rhipicephalus pulchellus TaxID=72859 RepID=L7LQY1_RHIPC